MAQRVVQYQAVIQLAQQAPQIYNLPQLHRQMLDVLGIKDADKLVPVADDQKPKDPVSENMNALKGTPMKAFIYQDHDAHIAVHMTMLQDPKMMQMIGQSPMAQQIQGAIMAHINEHLGFQYRRQIEETLGVPLPPPEESLPEDVEVQLSQLVAQAAAQLTQKHIAEAQAQQAAQQAQDPMVQMQMQELQIKAQKVQQDAQKSQAQLALQAQKMQADAQKAQAELTLKAQQQEIERARVAAEVQREGLRSQSKERSDDKKIQADIIKTLTRPPKPSR
jgi:hypothetical protein